MASVIFICRFILGNVRSRVSAASTLRLLRAVGTTRSVAVWLSSFDSIIYSNVDEL